MSGPALDQDAVAAVDFLQQHPHRLPLAGREVLTDVISADRKLAMAAINQDRELDRPWPAEVGEGIEGRPDGPSRIENVVDEDDDLVVHAAGQFGATHRPDAPKAKIVAVHRGVE